MSVYGFGHVCVWTCLCLISEAYVAMCMFKDTSVYGHVCVWTCLCVVFKDLSVCESAWMI